MEELNYDNMMALAKKYCDILPGLTPETKYKMEEICTPDCVYPYPNGQKEADHVAAHYKQYRAYLHYEPWPLCILVDEKKKVADCVLCEEARHPVTGEIVEDAFDQYGTKGLNGVVYMREIFEFTLHEGKVKIKNVFFSPINTESMAWKRWTTVARHSKEGIEPGLTYERMMAVTKKYCDLLPGVTEITKYKVADICAPDYVSSYFGGQTEADHVASHEDVYRAYLHYQPLPLYIMVDERKKMASTMFLEESRDPLTGKLVMGMGMFNQVTGVFSEKATSDHAYMRQIFEFELIDGEVKIKTVLGGARVDENSQEWKNWRDAKHNPDFE
jgi:hypothetical protein